MHPLLLSSAGASGLDVSHYRPVVSFPDLAASNASFVGVKATQGLSFVDPRLEYHRDGLRAFATQRNLLVIYYHFAGSGSPEAQVDFLLSKVGELQPNEHVALDLEEALPTSVEKTFDWVKAWYEHLWQRRTRSFQGGQVLCPSDFIYTSKRIWGMFGNPDWNHGGRVFLWAPRYNTKREPELPKPWEASGFKIWQWSDGDIPMTMSWPGVGECDLDVWNGSDRDLLSWTIANSGMPDAAGPAGLTSQRLLAKSETPAVLHVFQSMNDDELLRAKTFIEQLQEERAKKKI